MDDMLRRFKAELFRALAHPTRIAIVEALAVSEQPAGSLNLILGLEQANASQHLAVLRAKQVVSTRRSGNQIYYALRDPVLAEILGLLRAYFYTHLSESIEMLDVMKEADAATGS